LTLLHDSRTGWTHGREKGPWGERPLDSWRCDPGSLAVMETAGKVLLVSGVVLAVVGLGALGLAKLGVDRVPGTLSWKSDNLTVFVPLGLMLLVSIVGTIVLNVFLRR
jgi:hypothetical protein